MSSAALGGRSDADLPADRSGIAEVMREAESVADLPDDHLATRSVARSERNLLQRGAGFERLSQAGLLLEVLG